MRKLALIIALMLVLGSANVCFAGGDLSIQTLKSGVGAAIGIVNKPMGDAVKNINLTQTARGMANVAVNALPLGTDMRASGRNFLNGEITGVSQQANAAIGAVSRDIRPLTSEAYKAGLSVHMGISKVQDMLPSINLNSFGAVTKSLPAIKTSGIGESVVESVMGDINKVVAPFKTAGNGLVSFLVKPVDAKPMRFEADSSMMRGAPRNIPVSLNYNGNGAMKMNLPNFNTINK